MHKATYQRLYQRVGYGRRDGYEVRVEVEAHGFETRWDGLRVGVIRWAVFSLDRETNKDGEIAVIERGVGYFAETVERAVSLFRELYEQHTDAESEVETCELAGTEGANG